MDLCGSELDEEVAQISFQADSHAIKQIRFVRRIYRTTLYAESQKDENENDFFYMKYSLQRVTNIM